MRLGWVLVLALAACRGGAAPPTDAGAPAIASNAPKSYKKLPEAVVVDIRETADQGGRRGDVVVELTRVGDHFDWEGKGAPYPASLGERVPDPASVRTCSCEVTGVCPSCDGMRADDLQHKNGSLKAADVEAFLAEVARHGWGSATDAGVRFGGGADSIHVAISVPGHDDPVHLSYFRERRLWLLDDRPLAGDAAPLDAAYRKMSEALGIGRWLEALGPPIEKSLPAGFADLAKAVAIEIHDSWNGLGKTHDEVVRLERSKTGFDWRAKVASWSNALGESTPDPYTPKERDERLCICDIDSTCPCEHAMQLLRKKGTIGAAPVESFLRTVAAHTIDPSPPAAQRAWTDDYPKGHVVVWMTAQSKPVHLSFLNQRRQWRANGHVLSPDPPPAHPGALDIQHSAINASFRALLAALGQARWIDQVHALKTPPRSKVRF
jgi:hypothetical protein